MQTSEYEIKVPYLLIKSLSKLENIYELRLFGWILAKSQQVIKIQNKMLQDINIQYANNLVRLTFPAKYLLPPNDRDYKHIEKAFGLANKTIDYERDGTKYKLNIIGFPELYKKKGILYFSTVIHNAMWYALIDFQNRYRILNIATYMKLRKPVAVVMYFLVSHQSDEIVMSIKNFRELVGATGKAYDRYNNLNSRYIQAASQELQRLAPYTFDYEAIRSGKGGKVQAIRIRPRVNKDYLTHIWEGLSVELREQRYTLHREVLHYLKSKLPLTDNQLTMIEPYLMQHGTPAQQISKIAYICDCARKHNVENMAGYLYQSLKG